MTITYYNDLLQGSDEWLEARRGLLTASEMKLCLTPSMMIARNAKLRAHVYELAAQRATEYVEPHYVSDDMFRGQEDEADALSIYMLKCADIQACGFMVNDKFGFPIGYSPDGLVGFEGLVEAKSRRQKYQMQTIAEFAVRDSDAIPEDFIIQCQTGLLVSERKWLDFISYCGGMPMVVIRTFPDEEVQNAIVEAAGEFESQVTGVLARYADAQSNFPRMYPTERIEREEILV